MAQGWFEESERHSEAAKKGRGGHQAPLEKHEKKHLYALTAKDVQWLGMAPGVAGGGVTAWGAGDEPLSDIVRAHTGRDFLGTQEGISTRSLVSPETSRAIADEIEAYGSSIEGYGETVKNIKDAYKSRAWQIRSWVVDE